MKNEIDDSLKAIEREYGVQIIYACEAGSRTWGTHHDESDYDVRFLYIYPFRKYLELDTPKDSIEEKGSLHLECVGWELGKALRLLRKQNPSIIEWIHSPVEYVNCFQIKEKLYSMHQSYFDKKPLLYHYLNMATTNFSLLQKNRHDIKLQLNVIRPLLVCDFLFSNDRFPPLLMEKLLHELKEDRVRLKISSIISLKKQGVLEGIEFDSFVENWVIDRLEEFKEKLTNGEYSVSFSSREFTHELNRLYQDIVLEDTK
ncbi:nucleotidyltransferase domain-containing protein [Bacillus sp. AK128]